MTVVAAAQKVGNEIDEIPVARSGPHRHWKLELVEGTVLVVLGCVAGFVPFGFGIAIFMWLMVIGGITGLITTPCNAESAWILVVTGLRNLGDWHCNHHVCRARTRRCRSSDPADMFPSA